MKHRGILSGAGEPGRGFVFHEMLSPEMRHSVVGACLARRFTNHRVFSVSRADAASFWIERWRERETALVLILASCEIAVLFILKSSRISTHTCVFITRCSLSFLIPPAILLIYWRKPRLMTYTDGITSFEFNHSNASV